MSDTVTVLLNGYRIAIPPKLSPEAPKHAATTNWLVVKFRDVIQDRPDIFLDQWARGLQRMDAVAGPFVLLCKYEPADVGPIIQDNTITHFMLYPNEVVLHNNLQVYSMHREYAIHLHYDPFPSQSPRELLEFLVATYQATPRSNISEEKGFYISVDPTYLPEIAKIDSIRKITNVARPPHVAQQRAIGNFPTNQTIVPSHAGTAGYREQGEATVVADSGLEMGTAGDVQPAFQRRVSAATTAEGASPAADTAGNGTHVAGSTLGRLHQYSWDDASNTGGTTTLELPFR